MIVLLFIALAINYALLPTMFIFPDLHIIGDDWSMLYIAIVPRIIWFFGLMAGGVFWYYKRWWLFGLNIVGLICFYAPIMKYFI